MSDGVNDTVLS